MWLRLPLGQCLAKSARPRDYAEGGRMPTFSGLRRPRIRWNRPRSSHFSCGKGSMAALVLEGIELPLDRTSRRRCLCNRHRLVAIVVAHPLHFVFHASLIAALRHEIEDVVGAHHRLHTASVGRVSVKHLLCGDVEPSRVEPSVGIAPASSEKDGDRLARLEDVATRLDLLQKVNSSLAAATTREEMASVVVELAAQYVGVEEVIVFLGTDHGTFRSAAWHSAHKTTPDAYDEIAFDTDLPGARNPLPNPDWFSTVNGGTGRALTTL